MSADEIQPKTPRQLPTVSDAISDLPGPAPEEKVYGQFGWRKYPKKMLGDISKYAQFLRNGPPQGLGWPEAIELHKNGFVSGLTATQHSKEIAQRYSVIRPGKSDAITKAYRLDWDGQCPTIRAGTGADRRSAIMGAVRGKNTAPEVLVRKAAHRLGLRFRLHSRSLPGRPDLVLRRWKTVVFVNGCFWHRHRGCKKSTTPKSNTTFWKKKFRDNTRRDAENYAELARLGWRVVILWQCEAKSIDMATAALRLYFQRKRRVRRV